MCSVKNTLCQPVLLPLHCFVCLQTLNPYTQVNWIRLSIIFFLNPTTSESSVYPFLTRSASNNSWTISEIANWEKWAEEEKTERGVVFILNLNMPRATATKGETLTVDQVVSFMMGSGVIVANSWLRQIIFWIGVLKAFLIVYWGGCGGGSPGHRGARDIAIAQALPQVILVSSRSFFPNL